MGATTEVAREADGRTLAGDRAQRIVDAMRASVAQRGAAGSTFEHAHTADDFIDALVRSLEEIVENDPDFYTLLFEMFTLGRRNPEIAGAMADLYARSRVHVAELLRAKEAEGALALRDDANAIAGLILVLGEGVALQMLTEPEREAAGVIRAGATGLRALLGDA